MKKIHVLGVIACSAISLAGFTACTKTDQSDRNRSGTADSSSVSSSSDQNTSGEQIVSERATPLTSEESNQQAGIVQKRDDTNVKVQQETVKKETKTKSENVPTVISGQAKYDVNKMKADDFAALGLDKATAERIVKARDEKGQFNSVAELGAIQGVSESWLKQYQDRLAFLPTEQAGEAGK